MPNNRQIGQYYETLAAAYLEKNNYKILQRNFRCKYGEIDIIARDGRYLCFIEVKFRSSARYGYGMEAVTLPKQRTISKVALYYIVGHRYGEMPVRFDVVSIDGQRIQLLKNAFEYRG